MRNVKHNWFDKQTAIRNYYKQLQKDTEVTQITVTNHTDAIRKVCLWGAISCVPLTDEMTMELQVKQTVSVSGHPQAIAYNPVNDNFYVANQLADTVAVISSKGILLETIALYNEFPDFSGSEVDGLQDQDQSDIEFSRQSFINKSQLPGIISPVAIAINTNVKSNNYGEIAIACSVSDEVVFINLSHQITKRVNTDERPVSIVYNPTDRCYYTANLVGGSVSKICDQRRVNNLPNIQGACSVGVDTYNGDLYVFSTTSKQVQVFTTEGKFRGSYGTIPTKSVQFLFHPVQRTMYIVSDTLGQIDIIIPSRLRAITKIKLGNFPIAIAYNPHKQLVYVTTRDDQKIVTINTKNEIEERFELTDFNTGLAISTKADIIALSNSNNDTVSVFGNQNSPTVSVNEEYFEYRQDFQFNPTLISHIKMVASGEDRINALQLLEKSSNGKENCQTLSLANYQSPQNFCNVSEIFDIGGDIIDGHSIWCFKINPKQVVTFLIYHKQFEMYNVLPEKSRISTGVQMSKGIPASWLDNYNNEPPDESTY